MKIELDLEDSDVKIVVRALNARRAHYDMLHELDPEDTYWDDAQACYDLADKVAKAAGVQVTCGAYVYGPRTT